MGSGSVWHVAGVGGSCREEIERYELGESGTKEKIRHQDIKAEYIILGREEGLRGWIGARL